ncbi:MAG: winged helix-turn-helix transcriptional regulator [Herminiimonas sp.]|nr:winged helix-turn-helix transcriptional regulator [Herminiimonas sp.]
MKPLYLPCHCGSLRQAARVVTQIYDQSLKPSGVKITQFGILRLLAARPDLTTGDIANALAMDSTTLTRTLKIIKDSGWIDAAQGEDRRERRWTITQSGSSKIQEAIPLWKRAQEELAQLAQGVDLDFLNRTLFDLTKQVVR